MKYLIRTALAALLLTSVTAATEINRTAHIYESSDYGNHWSAADAGLPEGTGINALVMSDGRVFAGTDGQGVWAREKGVWFRQSKGLPREARIISLTSDEHLLFAGVYRRGIFYSADQGHSWQAVPGGPAQVNVRAMIAQHGTLFAGTDDGIFRVNVYGNAWQQLLAGVQVNDFDSDSKYIYAATHKGLLRSDTGRQWKDIYNGGAISKVVTSADGLWLVHFSGSVYHSPVDPPAFIRYDDYLPRPYLRLTPVSGKTFAGESSGITTIGPEPRHGLPSNVSLNIILETPDGLLAAGPGNGGGC